jgi:hypothetical protein
MTYMRSWKSHRLTSHTWLGLNPQIEKSLSRIVVPLVYYFLCPNRHSFDSFFIYRVTHVTHFGSEHLCLTSVKM